MDAAGTRRPMARRGVAARLGLSAKRCYSREIAAGGGPVFAIGGESGWSGQDSGGQCMVGV